MFTRTALIVIALLPAALPAAPPENDGLTPDTASALAASYDDLNRLDFDRSEREARLAMALQPDNIVPMLYLQDILASRIEESDLARVRDDAALDRFEASVRAALGLEEAREARLHDGLAQLYLGTTLGEEGLVDLSKGRLIKAYRNGRRANAALLLAKRRDPALVDADLGLGQYLYYCGRMNGFVRLVLDLHGDIPGGLALMRTAGRSNGRCALPARLVLALILTGEVKDYAQALPYVQEALARYPENWWYVRAALEEAEGLGLDDPSAQGLVEAVSSRWDAGWRPPAHAHLDPGPLRLALAEAYLKASRTGAARAQLSALAASGDPKTRAAAQKLLAGLAP